MEDPDAFFEPPEEAQLTRRSLPYVFTAGWLAIGLLAANGCSRAPDIPDEVTPGQTREEVILVLGDPDEIIEFVMPETPFFGPQESLANILPPGTPVEEWQYKAAGEVIYVWFAGEAAEPKAEWTVVDTATYPEDAAY